ncbi:putative transcriptional regulator [Streptomyces himastatinicus ATCC 53653]|uniref:Putative transcriptional regulator n=1 Tax=Streptomyces himastatinicus ATCC 53653 TaxID=457427 RepID=D9WIW8_9ACTN|nr:AraC family transcriptional regulator [Streptomyces himastatinicus]EFL27621.1 putative transcriptional regulator [Streptomyces himastatinicus ATCC 53653]
MMVDKRHPRPSGQAGSAAVPLYGFQPPVGTPYGLEVSTVEDFFAQHDDWPWNPPRPGRATFHYLILVTEGELRHDVDHVTRTVAPGQWLWVRPGHAQCWHPPGAARGPFILFEPDVLRSDIARLLAPLTTHEAPAVLSPHPGDAAWLQQTALQLLDEHRALGRRPLDIHHALRRSLLESLLLRLANAPGITPTDTSAGTGRGDTYGRFVDALELHFRELHRAADYAELLGCSVRTLSRAARDVTGKGVRELIDERRLLEARRLLGGARWVAQAVSVHLGFSDPANFGRFFRGHTGLTPAAFAAGEGRTGT